LDGIDRSGQVDADLVAVDKQPLPVHGVAPAAAGAAQPAHADQYFQQGFPVKESNDEYRDKYVHFFLLFI
jgi:hypothetical protein